MRNIRLSECNWYEWEQETFSNIIYIVVQIALRIPSARNILSVWNEKKIAGNKNNGADKGRCLGDAYFLIHVSHKFHVACTLHTPFDPDSFGSIYIYICGFEFPFNRIISQQCYASDIFVCLVVIFSPFVLSPTAENAWKNQGIALTFTAYWGEMACILAYYIRFHTHNRIRFEIRLNHIEHFSFCLFSMFATYTNTHYNA